MIGRLPNRKADVPITLGLSSAPLHSHLPHIGPVMVLVDPYGHGEEQHAQSTRKAIVSVNSHA